MAKCMHEMSSEGYCTCAFDQIRDMFKDNNAHEPTAAELATLRQKTIESCGSKFSDAEVKPKFTNACVGADPRKQAYCDCAWTALRKKLELSDLVFSFEGPKVDEAKRAMVTACKGKLPEPVAKENFMGSCTGSPGQTTKSCECTWKKLRVKASPEQIAAGLVDPKEAIEACKAAK